MTIITKPSKPDGKTKFTAFRCPNELYDKLLKDSDNRSKTIVNALESFKSKDYQKNITNAYSQFSKLFHSIELHFKNRSTLGLNEFINYINAYITNAETIDKIEEIIK